MHNNQMNTGPSSAANHLEQTTQQQQYLQSQAAGPTFASGSSSSPSPSATAAASSSEESTPWLEHHEQYGESHANPQPAPLPFAIPSAGPAFFPLGEDDDQDGDQDGDGDTGGHDDVGMLDPYQESFPESLATLPSPLPYQSVQQPPFPSPQGPTSTLLPELNFNPPVLLAPLPAVPPSPTISEDGLEQLMPSTTNPIVLGSENLALGEFLRAWAHFGRLRPADPHSLYIPGERSLNISRVREESTRMVEEVRYGDLQGDQCDLQGLNWTSMGAPRVAARARRRMTYRNYVNCVGADDVEPLAADRCLRPCEDYFRYRRMLMRQDSNLAHFQLRSVFACTSRSQLFYPTRRGIYRLNPTTRSGALAIDLGRFASSNNSITTLDANCGVLVGGTFLGDYVIQPLHTIDYTANSSSSHGGGDGSHDPPRPKHTQGNITTGPLALTNHLQVHSTRSSSRPVASIASNDMCFRTLDIESQTITSSSRHEHPFNCTAISPDLRLRIQVGDEPSATVCCAETGRVITKLDGHRDYAFACDWSDDGIHVATGAQDKRVKVWDARKWTDSQGRGTPVASIWCELAGARNLRFSPLGGGVYGNNGTGNGGGSVLVAAEEADYVSIIDIQSLEKKQTIDVFGELGGVTFADGGDELNILISDNSRGGIMQLDRCKVGTTDPRPAISQFVKIF